MLLSLCPTYHINDIWQCTGGVYAVLVRRQLQSAAQDSSSSLTSIGEDTVAENGSLQRAASEDPNADLLKRQSTGAGLP